MASAAVRNRMMVEMPDRVVVGYSTVGGELEELLANIDIEKLERI